MTSPFPGFDPFLESFAFWPDFHSTFINYWREAIADALPEQYEANIGERVYLVEIDPDARKIAYPDVSIVERSHESAQASEVSTSGATHLEPVTIPLTLLEGARESYIEILHRPDRRLVTSLELLSPSNKRPPGRTEYLAKRNALLRQDVHLVELDLLRGGTRLPLAGRYPPGDAFYLVSRSDRRPDCQVYAWTLPSPLPTLPVPLRRPDADLHVDLAAVFTTAFERGRFGRRIDYQQDESLEAFTEAERLWARRIADDARRNEGARPG